MAVIVAGIRGSRPHAPSRAYLAAGVLRFAAELTPGMHVQLPDGRWAVVADEGTTDDLGRMSIPVLTWGELVTERAGDVDPEYLLVGWGRRVRTRTPAEQRAYTDAVWTADQTEEGNEDEH